MLMDKKTQHCHDIISSQLNVASPCNLSKTTTKCLKDVDTDSQVRLKWHKNRNSQHI